MAAGSDEYFEAKARQEYGSHWHAQDNLRSKIFENTFLERRSLEAGWLVKGIKHPDDVGKDAVEAVFNQIKPPPPKPRPKPLIDWSKVKKSLHRKPRPRRRRRLTKEEEEDEERLAAAEALKEADRQARNERYLRSKVLRMKMLERVVSWLGIARYPAHHKHMPAADDLPADIKERNLRNYTLVPPQPIVETLRTVDEVFAEEQAANAFRVPGRYHHFRGAEKIYPLQMIPATAEVLLRPEDRGRFPEAALLPDESGQLQALEKARAKEKEKQRRIVRIRKAQMDMSRAQVHYDTPLEVREGVVVNQQFHYPPRSPQQTNSVHAAPHAAVHFKDTAEEVQSLQSAASSGQDHSFPPSVSYGLLGHADTSSATTSFFSSSHPFAHTQSQSLYEDEEDASDDDRAVRSNCLAENSTNQPLKIPVRMQRHRKILKLDAKHLKARPLLMSLRRKQRMLSSRERGDEL